MDIYEQFISWCKSQDFQGKLEKHHIIPTHDKGPDIPSNWIWLPLREHCLAHYYRWLALGQIGDKTAFYMRSGRTEESIKMIGQIAHKKQMQTLKREGKLWFDSEWQSSQGKKGGSVKSEAKTVANRKNCLLGLQKIHASIGSEGWVKQRRRGAITRQSPSLRESLSNPTTWEHVSGISVTILPCDLATDVKEALSSIRAINKNPKGIQNILKNREVGHSCDGWKLVSIGK